MENSVTSKLTEEEKQEMYKNARANAWYDHIWKNVGKCVFCDLKDKYILHEENGIVLTINIYPYIDGQMMVIPRKHISSIKELSELEWETMRKFSYIGRKLIKNVHKHKAMWNLTREGGENAQMTVTDHLHMQLIPFDNKDLCNWNFRELKYTPLQNVSLYKNEVKDIIKNKNKFEKKYSNKTLLPIVCDLIIKNDNNEILFQERSNNTKIYPNLITLPGGHVENLDERFELDLIREVKEEINLEIDIKDISLIDSRSSSLNFINSSKYLNSEIPTYKTFIWNTYLLNKQVNVRKLKAGDDCKKILWIPLKEINDNERISIQLRKTILKLFKL